MVGPIFAPRRKRRWSSRRNLSRRIVKKPLSITSRSRALLMRRARCICSAGQGSIWRRREQSMLERNPHLLGVETTSEDELLELERLYCSHGDTVHYTEPPKLFER